MVLPGRAQRTLRGAETEPKLAPASAQTTVLSSPSEGQDAHHARPCSSWLAPLLPPLTSEMAPGTSVRFWWRQATCLWELSQMQASGQRWAAACQAGPRGSSNSSSGTKKQAALWGLGEGDRASPLGQKAQAAHRGPSPRGMSQL